MMIREQLELRETEILSLCEFQQRVKRTGT